MYKRHHEYMTSFFIWLIPLYALQLYTSTTDLAETAFGLFLVPCNLNALECGLHIINMLAFILRMYAGSRIRASAAMRLTGNRGARLISS